MTRIALVFLPFLAACTQSPHLQPIPAPLMPLTVEVPTVVRIPIDLTTPCPEPPKRQIVTDTDLLIAADAFKTSMRCNAAKLKAIAAAQKQTTP